MKWREMSKLLRRAWECRAKAHDGSYYRGHIKEALSKKGEYRKAVSRYGSPLYVLDEAKLRAEADRFRRTFQKYIPNAVFFYAFKSNDLPYLIKVLKGEGFNADVGSLFELKLALKLGFKKIIFTSPGKSEEELKLAMKHDVIINIDNYDELKNIERLAKRRVWVSIRINSDDKLMQRWSKFGLELFKLRETIYGIQNKNIKVVGLHFHCSWNDTPERYCKNIRLIGDYLKKNFTKDFLLNLQFLDIGGGIYPRHQATLSKFSYQNDIVQMVRDFGGNLKFDERSFAIEDVSKLDTFGKEISKSLRKYIFNFNHKIKIYFEPGRYLNTNSTAILTRVIADKEKSVIVDGGINLIGGMDFAEYLFAPIVNLSNPSFKLKRKIIYGPLCTPNDLWGYSYFGKSISNGDTLLVLQQGSYNFSRAWRFLKETAPYVVIKKGKVILAKEREKFEERYSGCKF
jgi:diaminopimelate decarboxylase